MLDFADKLKNFSPFFSQNADRFHTRCFIRIRRNASRSSCWLSCLNALPEHHLHHVPPGTSFPPPPTVLDPHMLIPGSTLVSVSGCSSPSTGFSSPSPAPPAFQPPSAVLDSGTSKPGYSCWSTCQDALGQTPLHLPPSPAPPGLPFFPSSLVLVR